MPPESHTSPEPQPQRFPSDINYRDLRTEQPLDPQRYPEMQIPNPLDPMGRIASEGRAMRNLAGGRMPTWVLFCSWATIGLCSFLFLGLGLQFMGEAMRKQPSDMLLVLLQMLPLLIFPTLMLMVLVRATWRKSR